MDTLAGAFVIFFLIGIFAFLLLTLKEVFIYLWAFIVKLWKD